MRIQIGFTIIIGWSHTGGGKHSSTDFLWQDGQMFDFNDLIDTKSRFDCSDINDNGHISGRLRIPHAVSETHAALLIPNEP